jgi:hypothetical protein
MKRISMILSVMALLFAFTFASVSAQNAPAAKTSSEKVVSEKSDKAGCATDKKDGKSCAKTCTDDKAKAGCATKCSGDKAKSCCSKGSHTDAAKPVPASDKK